MSEDKQTYKILYEHQLRRNQTLVVRVENLKAELSRQKDALTGVIRAIDPTIHSMTRDEAKFFRSWLLDLALHLGWMLNVNDVKWGIRNLALGYSADMERELDMDNEDDKNLYELANHLDRLYTYMEID